jgi:hypothetical protein
MCRWEDDIKTDLKEHDGRAWNGFVWLRMGPVEGSHELWGVRKC